MSLPAALRGSPLWRAVEAMNAGRSDEAEYFLAIAERTASRDELLRFSIPFYRALLEERRGRIADAQARLDELESAFLASHGKLAPEGVELRRRLDAAAAKAAAPRFVIHPKFGRERVLERIPGAPEKLVIAFDEHGTKTLLSDAVREAE